MPAFSCPEGLVESFASPMADPEGQEKNRNARSPDIILFLTPLEI